MAIRIKKKSKSKIGQSDWLVLVIGLRNNLRVNMHLYSYSLLVRCLKLKKELEKKEKETSETGKVQEEK